MSERESGRTREHASRPLKLISVALFPPVRAQLAGCAVGRALLCDPRRLVGRSLISSRAGGSRVEESACSGQINQFGARLQEEEVAENKRTHGHSSRAADEQTNKQTNGRTNDSTTNGI